MISPVAASMPVLRALLRPRFSVLMRWTPNSRAMAGVSSVEPSLTTITSKFGYSIAAMPSRQSRIVRAPL